MQLEAPGLRLYLGLSLDPSLPRPGWRLSIKTSRGNLDPEFRNWEAGTGEGVRVMSSTLLWDLQVATGGVAHPPHPPPPPHCWLCMVRMGSILSGRASLSHTRLPTGLEHFNVGRRRPDLDTGLASPGADVQPLCWVKAESWHPPVQLFPRSLDETIRKTRAWRIPGTGKPGGLLSMGRTESDTTEAT